MASNAPPPPPIATLTLGTRRSTLARAQTDIVSAALTATHPTLAVPIRSMDPLGDRDKTTALYKLGDDKGAQKSLWTGELEVLLAAGEVDAIVHSLKDLPTTLPEGMELGAVLRREDPRDVLVLRESPAEARELEAGDTATADASDAASKLPDAHTILSALPAGSVIGTSSLRRIAQLRRAYPHLSFDVARGNVPTRLAKLDDPSSFATPTNPHPPVFAAIVLAAAGLKRLDLAHRISAYLSGAPAHGSVMHAVGQGAIGVEIRSVGSAALGRDTPELREHDARVKTLITALEHTSTSLAARAERAMLRDLEGGCSVPIGVETGWRAVGETSDSYFGAAGAQRELVFRATVVALDGGAAVTSARARAVGSADEAEAFGREVAGVLREDGAVDILRGVEEMRARQQEDQRERAPVEVASEALITS